MGIGAYWEPSDMYTSFYPVADPGGLGGLNPPPQRFFLLVSI